MRQLFRGFVPHTGTSQQDQLEDRKSIGRSQLGLQMRCNNFRGWSCLRSQLMLVTLSYVWSRLQLLVVELRKSSFDLVADHTESDERFFLTPRSFRRISKANVQPALHLAGEDGAVLVRVIADRDQVVEGILQELTHILRSAHADIDSNLFHHLDCRGVNLR